MSWYKKAQSIPLIFENNHTASYKGQHNFTLVAKSLDTKEYLGRLEYSEFDEKIYINYIKVEEKYRRQGIATSLYQELKRINPNMEIIKGMSTDEGSLLVNSLKDKSLA